MTRGRVWWGAVAVLGLTGACRTEGPPVTDGSEPTFHRDVRPILDAHCVECHQSGGVGPTDYTDASSWAEGTPTWGPVAVSAVESGFMPPWKPSDACHPLDHARMLEPEEQEVLSRWADAGFPLGDPSTYAPGVSRAAPDPLETLGPPDRVLRSEFRYTPDPSTPDDYRCFVVDRSVERELWIQGLRFEPDAVEMVHHAILYQLDARHGDMVANLEARDDAPGYTCFGSPGTWETETLAAWAPGQIPERYPDGVGRRVPEGSLLILQVHYNLLGQDPQALPDDATGLGLWLIPEGERPPLTLRSIPFANRSIQIPPGEPAHVERDTMRLSLPDGLTLRALGVMPHMHQLGTRIRINEVMEDGSRTCVFEIDDWDFNWQQTYAFPPDQLYEVSGPVTFELICEYDNSAANQPTVNGVQQEPQQVVWGDGTLDEMCLMYVNALIPTAVDR